MTPSETPTMWPFLRRIPLKMHNFDERKVSEAPKNVDKPLLIVYPNSQTFTTFPWLIMPIDSSRFSSKCFYFQWSFAYFWILPPSIFYIKSLSSTSTSSELILHNPVGSMNKIQVIMLSQIKCWLTDQFWWKERSLKPQKTWINPCYLYILTH